MCQGPEVLYIMPCGPEKAKEQVPNAGRFLHAGEVGGGRRGTKCPHHFAEVTVNSTIWVGGAWSLGAFLPPCWRTCVVVNLPLHAVGPHILVGHPEGLGDGQAELPAQTVDPQWRQSVYCLLRNLQR